MKDKHIILLVDDKPANILVLENLLDGPDRTLITASSGEEALSLALQQQIDLIILDVQMPVMDGFEVAQTLKLKKQTRNIPIIFATAESKEHRFIMKGYDEGAIDYLFKPLNPDIVRAKVNVLLKIQQQQKELLEKNTSLQNSALLINNSADIIGIIDEDSLVVEEVNQAFSNILGYSLDEVVGRAISCFVEPAAISDIQKGHTFETPMHCRDGSVKWLQWKVVARNGKLFFNARDVTEQKSIDVTVRRLNDELHSYVQQLQMTNKELESFSYSVSHDLRAPLRALSGYSAIMQKDYGSRLDDEARRLLNNIQLNAQRMGDLIDDLLEFSRLGRKEIQRSKVDMNKIVHTAIDEVSKAMPHKAHFQLEELPAADADQGLIQQVWVNLISNAVKYSSKKEHPEVRIGARETDERVEYFVRDNGAGFDMHFADKLFGVFQRLHRASEFDGTGVGLAIVQRIIVKHGGSIWATAEKGQGAEFCFYLAKKNSN